MTLSEKESEALFSELRAQARTISIMQCIGNKAYIPLGYLYDSENDGDITSIECMIVVTYKGPDSFDIEYGYFDESSDQKIVKTSLSDNSLEEAGNFIYQRM